MWILYGATKQTARPARIVLASTDSTVFPMIARLTRGVVALHVLALLVQMSAAIVFASGTGSAYLVHRHVAWVVFVLGILQATAVWNPALPKVHLTYRFIALLVVVGEVLQLFVIPRGHLDYHVSIAMVVWGGTLALFVRLLDPDWGKVAAA